MDVQARLNGYQLRIESPWTNTQSRKSEVTSQHAQNQLAAINKYHESGWKVNSRVQKCMRYISFKSKYVFLSTFSAIWNRKPAILAQEGRITDFFFIIHTD